METKAHGCYKACKLYHHSEMIKTGVVLMQNTVSKVV